MWQQSLAGGTIQSAEYRLSCRGSGRQGVVGSPRTQSPSDCGWYAVARRRLKSRGFLSD